MDRIKEELAVSFGIKDAVFFVDKRSPNFFYMKHESGNYMVMVKDDYPEDLHDLVRKFTIRDYPELPTYFKESSELILFQLPEGKLRRLTEERMTPAIQEEAQRLQEKLNSLTSETRYNWAWEINYFFRTPRGIMYIDIETIQEDIEPQILTLPCYQSLSLVDRVKLKIQREKKKLSF